MAGQMCTDSAPNTMWDLCLSYCLKYLDTFCTKLEGDQELYILREGVTLPTQICESMIRFCHDNGFPLDDSFLHIFKDRLCTRLKQINLRDSYVTDLTLEWLMPHQPTELDISSCQDLTHASIGHINKHGKHLVKLYIGDSVNIINGVDIKGDEALLDEPPEVPVFGRDYIFNCPNMRAFSMHNLNNDNTKDRTHDIIATVLNPFKHLSYLDLSHCEVDIEFMDCLENINNLTTLLLHNVSINHITGAVQQIGKLKQLRVLDVSQCRDTPVIYIDPEQQLSTLMRSLPHLVWLDLSGTNLAGFQSPQSTSHRLEPETHLSGKEKSEDDSRCCIPGLEGRRLEFLGLLCCAYDACFRNNIPAKQVTGDANEDQILLSVKTYIDKPDLLMKALNNLFSIFRVSTCCQQRRALKVILNAMRRHRNDKHIQISGSASLFFIVKGEEKEHLGHQARRQVISAILDAMENHFDDATMMRNGCLTLCHFQIPQDVLFTYDRLVVLLLKMVEPSRQEEYVQRISIYLLNSLACQVDGSEKQLVGDLGAITAMLEIIRFKLDLNVCDEILEIAWSTMWNVTGEVFVLVYIVAKSTVCTAFRSEFVTLVFTRRIARFKGHETAVNCERFIENNGLNLFLQCLEQFPDRAELLRNMMGLLGNVAEVDYLRCRLMAPDFVIVFSDLLDSTSDGIEVSYNACGVLSHMVSDGPTAWTIDRPPRSVVLDKMVDAINRWNIKTKRNINYRSFEPILRLLPKFNTPECQQWALWALCNLTTMYPHKYCPLIEKEGGRPLLQQLLVDSRPSPGLRDLGQKVMGRCDEYRLNPESVEVPNPDVEMENLDNEGDDHHHD